MEQGMLVAQPDGNTVDARWAVDLEAAEQVAAWAHKNRDLLARELAEMDAFFPRWVLTAGDGSTLARCAACHSILVPRERRLRCLGCGRGGQATHLAWMGHLPIPVSGLPRALACIRRHPDPAYPLVPLGDALVWLVPIVGFYPQNWPHSPPVVCYDAAFFEILGLGLPTARIHVVGGTMMCLYGGNQWRRVTFRVVLQQRVVNHLASLLKVADGQTPAQAFRQTGH